LSDNGTEFTNETLAYVCQQFGIKQQFTSPYTPRSNGKCENFNKFLKSCLRKLCQDDQRSWDEKLGAVLSAYRSCPHTSSGESPFFLYKGRDPPLPIQELIKVVEGYKGDNSLGHRIDESRVALAIAAKGLDKIRANQRKAYINRKSVHPFKVGDLVYLKNHAGKKFDRKWQPDWRIIKLTSGWSCKIENCKTWKTRKCNVSHLKLKLPSEDWEQKPEEMGRAARFVNHPDKMGDFEFMGLTEPEAPATHSRGNNIHNLRKKVKPPDRLDL